MIEFLRLWPVLNNLYFVIGHNKAKKGEDIFQILYQLEVKFPFLYFSIKTSFVKMLKYFFHIPMMFKHVI